MLGNPARELSSLADFINADRAAIAAAGAIPPLKRLLGSSSECMAGQEGGAGWTRQQPLRTCKKRWRGEQQQQLPLRTWRKRQRGELQQQSGSCSEAA